MRGQFRIGHRGTGITLTGGWGNGEAAARIMGVGTDSNRGDRRREGTPMSMITAGPTELVLDENMLWEDGVSLFVVDIVF